MPSQLTTGRLPSLRLFSTLLIDQILEVKSPLSFAAWARKSRKYPFPIIRAQQSKARRSARRWLDGHLDSDPLSIYAERSLVTDESVRALRCASLSVYKSMDDPWQSRRDSVCENTVMSSQANPTQTNVQAEFRPAELTRLGEKILMSFCRDPKGADYRGGTVNTRVETALDFLNKTVPNFRSYLQRKILDFGCGRGNQSVAMAKAGAGQVVGLDIRLHDHARKLAADYGCSDRVRFVDHLESEELQSFDMVLSCSAMEHYADPVGMLELMKRAVKPGGVVIISFAEPWFGPRGSHFDAFSRLPWVNLFFSEQTILRVRTHFRCDGAQRFEDVEGGLNRMSVAKFERIIGASGLKREFFRVYVTKSVPFLGHIPVARELFASAVACVLRKQTES